MNTYNDNNKEEKKGGFGTLLSNLLRGGSSATGGISSGAGSTGGLAGLFAGKAGLAGMLLGGATLAAGVGVVYNFIGSPDKPVYNQELFQNSYYEEEAARAGKERADARNSGVASSIDVFKEQARKEGLGGLAAETADGEAPEASADAPKDAAGADAAADAPAVSGSGSGSGAGGVPKMVASSGFAGKGGGAGSGSSMPRMQGGGGLSGGIGGQFTSVYRPPAQANAGKTSGMSASAARVKSSPKIAVPSFNKKGAFGQAKFAGKMGARAAGSTGAASSAYATEAMTGGGTGSGDVGGGTGGAGLGGAGVSSGANLKGSDPNMSSNESTPPKVPEPENVSPWQKTLDMIMYAMLAAAALIFIANAMAASKTPWMVAAAQYVAMAAMLAAFLVIVGAITMMSKYGQKWTGIMYTVLGGALLYMANEARTGASEKAAAAEKAATKSAEDSVAKKSIDASLDKKFTADAGTAKS